MSGPDKHNKLAPPLHRERFWELPLEDLNPQEWEALCDGCARCCMSKLQHEMTNKIYYTRVVCRYLDQQQCKCTAYDRRQELVPDCVVLTPENLATIDWMPDTCAYKLRANGDALPAWHPLLTGSRRAMKAAGITVTGKVISEDNVHPEGIEEHIIRWVDASC